MTSKNAYELVKRYLEGSNLAAWVSQSDGIKEHLAEKDAKQIIKIIFNEEIKEQFDDNDYDSEGY